MCDVFNSGGFSTSDKKEKFNFYYRFLNQRLNIKKPDFDLLKKIWIYFRVQNIGVVFIQLISMNVAV